MGTLIHPKGQTVTVPDDTEDYYLQKGWAHAGTRPAEAPSEHPDKSWKNDDLVAYAAEHSIDLDGATKKDDLLSAIAANKKIEPVVPPVEGSNPIEPVPEVVPDGDPVTPSE